jgi:hypothetical protein
MPTYDQNGNQVSPPGSPYGIGPNGPIITQIFALEETITIRRIREAVLGTDGGWLKAIDAQIAALRGQLSK